MPHKTDDPLAQLLAAKSPVRKQAGGAVKAAKKLAPGEQKMLQGFYRGFAGEFDTPTVSRETGKIFVSPQKAVGEHYARRRAMQAGSEPHLEMILADPFAGRGYGHAPATTARERTLSTVARQLAPEDIADIYQFYADGGRVTPEEMHGAYPAQPRRPEKYDFERAKASLGRVPGNVAEFVIPQDMVDVAMYAFPFGKVGKVLGGGMVVFNPGEAEAGKVDTARRALLGLRSAPEPQAGALVPRVERSIEKIAEMPVSRRTLFKGAGSQALQSMLPARGIMQALSPTNVVKEVIGEAVRPAGPTTMQGIIAQAARMGLDDEQTLKLLRTLGPGAESDALYMIDTLRRPMDFVGDLGEEAVGRGRAMANLLGTDVQRPMQMRGPLREIRRENPEMYEELRQVARDIADYGHEF